jgi:prepilin-type N-terminal cleavage/methylation domain-containing protein/prepilin-type processing-associated H-X9-DG protein
MKPASVNERRGNLLQGNEMRERAEHSPKGAFTLIEMLVVIAITAILAAIALPAISTMRESGNDGKCVANLKALHAIATTYASDYGFYPPAYDVLKPLAYPASDPNGGGYSTFPSLAYSSPCSVCPSAEHTGKNAVNAQTAPHLLYQAGYAVNPKVMPFANTAYMRVRPSMIQRPSQVILLGDTSQWQRQAGMWVAFPTLVAYTGDTQTNSDSSAETSIQMGPGGRDKVFQTIPENDGDGPSIRFRHKGRANLIFVDGHLESITNVSQLKQKNLYYNY